MPPREIHMVRLKSGLEMIALVLNSIKSDETAATRELSKIFGGLDFDLITMYAQMDVWNTVMRGLPGTATTTDAFLLFLEQVIQYIRGARERMPDAILDDPDNEQMFRTREQVIRVDMGDAPTIYRMREGDAP